MCNFDSNKFITNHVVLSICIKLLNCISSMNNLGCNIKISFHSCFRIMEKSHLKYMYTTLVRGIIDFSKQKFFWPLLCMQPMDLIHGHSMLPIHSLNRSTKVIPELTKMRSFDKDPEILSCYTNNDNDCQNDGGC